MIDRIEIILPHQHRHACILTLNVHVLLEADTFPTTHGACTLTVTYIHPNVYCGALTANTQH